MDQETQEDFADDGGSYRGLIHTLLDDVEGELFTRVLLPWLAMHPGEIDWLASLRERGRAAIPVLGMDELWRLYALGRLCELLVFEAAGHAVPALRLTMAQCEDFFTRLGIDVSRPTDYTPFHHEVVDLVPASLPDEAPRILGYEWPCLMLGSLLLMRGGVRVSAGEKILAPGIAEASTLYWAYWRPRRPTHDQAHGWGSHSAWRTAFRRDYALGGHHHLNVDGTVDLALCRPDEVDEYGLTVAQRVELLMNRSFVTTNREHADLFPYLDRLSTASLPTEDASRLPFWKRLFAR